MRIRSSAQNNTSQLTAVLVAPESICLVRVERDFAKQPRVTAWNFVPLQDENIDKALKRLAKTWRLARTRCSTLLHPDSYRILLVDAPNVPATERTQALRWIVKDMVDIPVSELKLQSFDFPETSNDKEKQIYIVAARAGDIEKFVESLRDNAVGVEIIDIMEMAQRNLAELLPEDTRGTAMVTLFLGTCVITLSKQGTLYVTRRLDIPAEHWKTNPEQVYERIALEVQRSLDYYNRHFGQAPIEQVYLTPAAIDLVGLLNYLSTVFPTPPRLLDLNEIISWVTPPPASLYAPLALAVGAALRQEEKEEQNAPAN